MLLLDENKLEEMSQILMELVPSLASEGHFTLPNKSIITLILLTHASGKFCLVGTSSRSLEYVAHRCLETRKIVHKIAWKE